MYPSNWPRCPSCRNYAYVAVVFILAGCGGASFSSGLPEVKTDAGDAASESSTPADTDAGYAASESSTPADAAAMSEANEASACTPYTSGFTYTCYNTLDNLVIPEPSQFCFAKGSDINTAQLYQLSTPPECRCEETFNCTCIAKYGDLPCASPSCNEASANGMTSLVLGCP